MSTINPKIIDTSHYNRIAADGFQQARRAGYIGIIQKASEGSGLVDDKYAARVSGIVAAGLLAGAYHFIRPGNMTQQAEFFLRCAQPNDHTEVSLDFEVPNVPPDAARAFIEHVEVKIGRKVVLYSGNTIKEDLGTRVDPWWGERRLWLAQYARNWTVQRSWKMPTYWQFTGDNAGPTPHYVPGIGYGVDISSFDGSDEQLCAQWASGGIPDPVPPTPHPDPGPVPPPGEVFWLENIIMTEFGGPGDPQNSAYTGRPVDPNVPSVSIPYRFHGNVPSVLVKYGPTGKVVPATTVDVGPHFIDDNYFTRPGRRPRAESVGGNHAGLDGTRALHNALGIPGKSGWRTAVVSWGLAP